MALWRIRATVDDRPGFLAVLAASLALRSVNILAVQVHTTEAGAVDDFLVDAPDTMSGTDLLAAVEKGRGRDAWVTPAQAQGLVDPPTQALALAGRVARDPDALGDGLRALLGGDSVVWRPDGAGPGIAAPGIAAPGNSSSGNGGPGVTATGHGGPGDGGSGPGGFGFDERSMRLPDPYGGAYEVVRRAPAFTPAEYARAQALVDLAAAATGQQAARTVLLLADGTELLLRPAGADDVAELRAMHERCSTRTRQRRYLAGTSGPSAAHLARLLDAERCTALVAVAGDGRIVAMANLVGEGDQAEVALLVEDAWQGRGLGTALLRRVGTLAARSGFAAMVAYTHADNGALLRTLRRLGRPSTVEHDGSVVTVTLPLDSREVSAAAPGTEAGTGAS